MLDLSSAWQVKSDRLNADDIIGLTPTVTVQGVDWPKGGQPRIHLEQYPGRPYCPSAGMGRVMREVWGSDGEAWAGRRLTLFHKPDVEFNKERTGGIRIMAMSHMDRPRTFEVKEKRGLRVPYTIQPLPDAPAAPQASTGEIPAEVIANVEKAKADGNLGAYRSWLEGQGAPPEVIAYVKDQEQA